MYEHLLYIIIYTDIWILFTKQANAYITFPLF